MKIKLLVLLASGAVASGALTACAPILAGGVVAGATTVATDRRTTGTQVNDQVMESRIEWEIGQKIKSDDMHLTVTCYNGKVLLTGEVLTQEEKETAGRVARNSLEVSQVINELAVQVPASFSQRMKDSSLAASVRSRIIGTSNATLNQMKVTVDRGIVYLMGLVTEEEGQAAAAAAAKTSGVKRVVKVFEYQTAAEINKRLEALKVENPNNTDKDQQ